MAMNGRHYRLILLCVHMCLAVYWLRYAWLTEDAFINFRVLRHALHGEGLVWNPGERVQVFTSPLWVLLSWAAAELTREFIWTTLVLSFSLCVGTCWLLFKHSLKSAEVYLPVVVFAFASKSLRDFSSSGLETPLLVFSLVCFYGLVLGEVTARGLRNAVICFALCLLVRHDSVLLTLPFLTVYAWRAFKLAAPGRAQMLLGIVPGLVLILAWTFFSLIYYGSPLPNTAAAKVVSGLNRLQNFENYFLFNLAFDPVGFVWISLALFCVFLTSRFALELIAALVLYLMYMYWVSCDYMAGRFLIGPIVLSVMLVVRLGGAAFPGRSGVIVFGKPGVAAAVFLAGALAVLPNESLSNLNRKTIVNGVADERGYYYGSTDFETLFTSGVVHPFRQAADVLNAQGLPPLIVGCNIGISAYYLNEPFRMLDPYALADRFLVMLPVRSGQVRVGHVERMVPWQYISSLINGSNDFSENSLRRAFDDVQLVVTGNLFSRDRFAAMWRLLAGQHRAALQSFSDASVGGVAKLRAQDQRNGDLDAACLGSGGAMMIPMVDSGGWSLRLVK
jgi:arabinofuranosyltransferase